MQAECSSITSFKLLQLANFFILMRCLLLPVSVSKRITCAKFYMKWRWNMETSLSGNLMIMGRQCEGKWKRSSCLASWCTWFFSRGTGGRPAWREFCLPPPSDTCPRFWTKVCTTPPPPRFDRPRKFEKFKYIVSNLTTFMLKSILKSCLKIAKNGLILHWGQFCLNNLIFSPQVPPPSDFVPDGDQKFWVPPPPHQKFRENTLDPWCALPTPCSSFLALYRSSRCRLWKPLLVSYGAGQRLNYKHWQVNSRWTIIQARIPFTNRAYSRVMSVVVAHHEQAWLIQLHLGNNPQSWVGNCSALCVIAPSQQARLACCVVFVKGISAWIIMTDKKNQRKIQMKKSSRKKKGLKHNPLGYLVERWVRGCAAQIWYFFGLSGLSMAPFLFENWFRYRSRFCKMHNFRLIFPLVYL